MSDERDPGETPPKYLDAREVIIPRSVIEQAIDARGRMYLPENIEQIRHGGTREHQPSAIAASREPDIRALEARLEAFAQKKNADVPYAGKDDSEKIRFDLMQHQMVREYARVLTFGAKKYKPESWRSVENARARYYAAAFRHLIAWWMGETRDKESGLHHLAHTICNFAFLGELDLEQEAQQSVVERLK